MPVIQDSKRLTRILCGVARNPSVPADVVWRLIRLPAAAREVGSVATSPKSSLVPSWTSAMSRRRSTSDTNDRIPVSVRWLLAAHAEPEVRASAARHALPELVPPGHEVPAALLEHLADDPDPQVRTCVAEHSTTPEEVRARLASDPDPTVRATIAQRWTQAPEPARRVLLTDADARVRAAALSLRRLPPPADLHAALLADEATCHLVVPHIRLSPELADDLAASPNEEIRQALAGHPDLPAPVRDRLSSDPDLLVRIRLVMNPNTPEGTRTQLLAGLDPSQSRTDQFLIPYFLRNAYLDKTVLGWLREAPLAERLTYLDSPHVFFREAVAASPDLPQHAIDRLLADPDPRIRQIVAKTHDVPGDVLEELVREHGDIMHILPLLVERPTFPPAAFVRFAASDHARLRRLALYGKDLPATFVARLVADPEPHIRRAAAEHPNLPTHCLPTLLTADELDIAEAAAAAPSMPLEWTHRLVDQANL